MTAAESLLDSSMTATVGSEMHRLIADLYPICRSITGNGVRETLRYIARHVPLSVSEVPSGTTVFDWTVPREWNIRDAWIKNVSGERVVDFRQSNLHVVSYSVPFGGRVPVGELRKHLHSLPDHPDWIPYKTSYYSESWGFCVTANHLSSLTDPEYDVCIDSTLEDGHLTYGELFLPGESADEVLLSSHVCHPSLCNDNLSGIAVAVLLARWLSSRARRRLSYRFLFIPGTIGSITWLARNQEKLGAIRHGLVLTGLGSAGALVYKRSRRGSADVDRAAAHVLSHESGGHEIRDFFPYGYDERQFCSPGIDLAVGCLSRTPYGEYPEYHTSADNLAFVGPEALEGSFRAAQSILTVLEENARYINLSPMCEPQLGKRGLYGAMGGAGESRMHELAMLWVLNLSDGRHSLLDIAERSRMAFEIVRMAADRLAQAGLLRQSTSSSDVLENRFGDA
jgi:aminopeptidase-like protein